MSEVKDPKIKLFGMTIDLLEIPTEAEDVAAPSVSGEEFLTHSSDAGDIDNGIQDLPCSSDSMLERGRFERDIEKRDSLKSLSSPKQDDAKEKDHNQPLMSEELKDRNSTSPISTDSQAPFADDDIGAAKAEDEQTETSNSHEKTLKKPDKILPCPRCNSMDTKFCYFNNYNVNQPRHFCKNCQRYWTAGGTMRNVPIGAGRRKNKNATAQFRHLTVQEALQSARVELPNGITHTSLKPNGNVLTFSSDAPLCESMASVLDIADKTIVNRSISGLHKPVELQSSVSHGILASSEDRSCGTSATSSSLNNEVSKNVTNCHALTQMPCYPGAPWPYPWNSVPWSSPLSPPAFGAATFPLPFCPTLPPIWSCTVPGTWNVPWVITPAASQNHTPPPSSALNSPTLGKHSRDDNNISRPSNGKEVGKCSKDGDFEKNLWVPKTLRIDDMGEAAKNSILETLGIKNDRADSVGGRDLFKAFQCRSKSGEKGHGAETSTVLQANPAALSRSMSFHESS